MPYGLQYSGFIMVSNLKKVLQDYNIQDKVRKIVVEKATNMGVAIRETQQTCNLVPVKCLDH